MVEVVEASSDGRELTVECDVEGKKFKAVLPGEFLDDELGDDASEEKRRTFISENDGKIANTISAIVKGGFVNKRFSAIRILK